MIPGGDDCYPNSTDEEMRPGEGQSLGHIAVADLKVVMCSFL